MSTYYQISFLAPDLTNRKREPSRRKGESRQSFRVRWETWRRLTYREKSEEEKRQAIEIWTTFRETCQASTQRHCRGLIESAKTRDLPGAMFFWFGGRIGIPGPQSQYLTQASLNYLKSIQKTSPRWGEVWRGAK